MPRKARHNYYSEIFHIMIQGINRELIFNSDQDKDRYLKILKKNLLESNAKILSYCIMNNHAHLMIYAEKTDYISKLMSKTNTKFAICYNKKRKRCGPVFRDRYRAEEITTASYLLNCIRYIHNNPVKAKICKKKEDYYHSSVQEYNFNSKYGIIDIDFNKKLFKKLRIDFYKILAEKDYCGNFMEISEDIEATAKETEMANVVKMYAKEKGVEIEHIKENNVLFRNITELLFFKYNIQQKQIAEFFAVSTSKISNLINRKTKKYDF